MPTFKFLGILFDKKLSWKPHILNLVNRSQQTLRLLRVVSHCRWGADLGSLRLLYISLLLPKLEYGDFLYSSAAPSTLKMLARVQFAAARTILGALKCTPCNALEAEAELMPLHILRKIHLMAYAGRVLSIPQHPVAELLKLNSFNNMHYNHKIAIPTVRNMLNEFTELSILPCHFPVVSLSDRLVIYSFQCNYSLHITNKDDLTPSQWRTQFSFLIQSHYTEHKHILCDGSAAANSVGSAVWADNLTVMARLSSTASVYTSELYAIYIALQYIRTQPNKYVIFSDSLSSLRSLDCPTSKSHYLVHYIHKIISNMTPGKITIEWVPSHQGITGNENADRIAKISLNLQTISCKYISSRDYKNTLQKHYFSSWQEEYTNSHSRLLAIKPHINNITTYCIKRSQQVAYTRLRLGTWRKDLWRGLIALFLTK